jgi:ATP-binding cassette subfamily F protein uup
VVTSTIAFEGEGRWREYEGGVQDWLTQSRRAQAIAAAAQAAPATVPAGRGANAPASAPLPAAAPAQRRKLSYKEQRELEALPALIESLETEQAGINTRLADGSLYATDPTRAAALAQRNAEIDDALLQALERWEVLGP